MKILILTDKERDTLIAALRFWQREGNRSDLPEWDLAVNDREGADALTEEEIDELIEDRINVVQTPAHAVVVGNPINGLQFLGPFDHLHKAVDYATQNCETDWWTAEILPPGPAACRTTSPQSATQPAPCAISTLIAIDTLAVEDEIGERAGLGRFDGPRPTRTQINEAIARARIPDSFYDEFDRLRSHIIDDLVDAAARKEA